MNLLSISCVLIKVLLEDGVWSILYSLLSNNYLVIISYTSNVCTDLYCGFVLRTLELMPDVDGLAMHFV